VRDSVTPACAESVTAVGDVTDDLPVAGRWHQDRERLARFLDRDFRQVWAVNRVTGERVFLDRGQADALREVAKRELRCPVPGCIAVISTRGKSRRDHFFHVGEGCGHSDGESEWHLQAKAMVADWAAVRGGSRIQVREEETVKDEATRVHRRADAMVTWVATGRKVAFEVEYKAYAAEAWRTKHTEYADHGIGCVWLFGHTNRYLHLARRPVDLPADEPVDRVKWTPLTSAVAQAGLAVLFVNPVERTIGTLVQFGTPFSGTRSDRYWWQQAADYGPRLATPGMYDGDYDDLPQVMIDPIDDCELEPGRGLLTPTMRRIAQERALIDAEAEKDRAVVEAEDRARSEQEARQAQERAKRKGHEQRQRDQRDASLAAHCAGLRRSLIARLGSLPGFLEVHTFDREAFHGNPQDWTIFLFAELMRPRQGRSPVGRTFTYRRLYSALLAAGFRDGTGRTRAMREFLIRLWRAGYIDFQFDRRGLIEAPIRVRADLSADPTPRRPDESPFPAVEDRPVVPTKQRLLVPQSRGPEVAAERGKSAKTFERELMERIIAAQCRRCGHVKGPAGCNCPNADGHTSAEHRSRSLQAAGVPANLAPLLAAMGAEVITENQLLQWISLP